MESLKEVFLGKYPKYECILRYFREATQSPADWDNINKVNLNKFAEYLTKKVSLTSARTYAAMFKSVVNLYKEEFNISADSISRLKVKNDTSQAVYLNGNEIKKIATYEPKSDYEKYVRDVFVIGCLTGARHSDYASFEPSNIREDGLLTYVAEKTKIEATIPTSPFLLELLEEVNSIDISITDPAFCKIIRRICKSCGINGKMKIYRRGKYEELPKWQFVASHTARRSFATNMYLKGVDLYAIAKMMGHTNTRQTERYICCGLRNIPSRATEFLNSFGN
jgi:integrase